MKKLSIFTIAVSVLFASCVKNMSTTLNVDPKSSQMATPEGAPDNVTNAPSNGAAASGETDPVLLRLMQRRQQENQ